MHLSRVWITIHFKILKKNTYNRIYSRSSIICPPPTTFLNDNVFSFIIKGFYCPIYISKCHSLAHDQIMNGQKYCLEVSRNRISRPIIWEQQTRKRNVCMS